MVLEQVALLAYVIFRLGWEIAVLYRGQLLTATLYFGIRMLLLAHSQPQTELKAKRPELLRLCSTIVQLGTYTPQYRVA